MAHLLSVLLFAEAENGSLSWLALTAPHAGSSAGLAALPDRHSLAMALAKLLQRRANIRQGVSAHPEAACRSGVA